MYSGSFGPLEVTPPRQALDSTHPLVSRRHIRGTEIGADSIFPIVCHPVFFGVINHFFGHRVDAAMIVFVFGDGELCVNDFRIGGYFLSCKAMVAVKFGFVRCDRAALRPLNMIQEFSYFILVGGLAVDAFDYLVNQISLFIREILPILEVLAKFLE